MLIVMACDLSLLAFMGLVCVRLGRLVGRPPVAPAPPGLLLRRASRVLAT